MALALEDSVRSLMNPRVISVLSNTPVLVAIDIILTNKFNGLPVTDNDGVIVGIVTKYDIISKRSYVREDTKVGDLMNVEPLTLPENSTVEDAITAFVEHHRVDPIPVINESKKVIGIISRADMMLLFKEYGINPATDNNTAKSSPKNQSEVARFIVTLLIITVLGALVYYFFF